MGKEGSISRLLKSDLVAVVADFQRQNQVFLCIKIQSYKMDIYEEMRQSPEPPLSLPFRVILKGLIPYPELRDKVKNDFLEIFPGMIIYDPPEDLFEDDEQH